MTHDSPEVQLSGITCDSASNNAVMIDELKKLVDTARVQEWGESASRVRCFLHVVNLIAQTLLKQFDILRKKKPGSEESNGGWRKTAAEQKVRQVEEAILEDGANDLPPDEEPWELDVMELEDNKHNWVDELALVDEVEHEEHLLNIHPLRLALAKVHCVPVHVWVRVDMSHLDAEFGTVSVGETPVGDRAAQ